MTYVVEHTARVGIGVLNRCSDGIFEVRLSQGSRIGIDEIDELLATQQRMTHELSGVLVDARGTVSMTRAAQERTANNPVNDLTAATAILVGSPVSALLGNFFIRFGRPPYPARLFRKEDAARQWLLDHLARRSRG